MADPFLSILSPQTDRIHQGDVFCNVPSNERYREVDGVFTLTQYEFPFAMILSQECDLEQNKTKRTENKIDSSVKPPLLLNDRHLISVLAAPIYNAEQLKDGIHLTEAGIKHERLNSDRWRKVKQNDDPRYHYCEFPKESSIPEGVIDFVHYFSVSVCYLEECSRTKICTISDLYTANIIQRFSSFLSRIGLPDRPK